MKPIIIYNCLFTRLMKLDGIVLFPFVLISTKEEETLPSVIKHELTHVRQIYREGFFSFYFQYVCMMMKNISYFYSTDSLFSNNSFEDEAYEIENEPLNEKDKLLSNWKGPDYDDDFHKNK
jgi:hypothetical protein